MRIEIRWLAAALFAVAGCASLAVNPCDTVADRDGKYLGRFFLGVSTIGLSEVVISQEETRQAYETAARGGCPVPEGTPVVTASVKEASNGMALGTLVNGAPWAIAIYLNQSPDTSAPTTILFPGGSTKLAFESGRHQLVARPTGAAGGDLPDVTWSRQIEVDPRVRGFRLEFEPADFK